MRPALSAAALLPFRASTFQRGPLGLLLLLLLLLAPKLQAQELVDRVSFDITGYTFAQRGYPSPPVAGPDGQVVFVEFWNTNQSGRRQINWYLQALGADFQELWFTPLSALGETPLLFDSLYRSVGGYAVTGRVPDRKGKNFTPGLQWFTLQGQRKGPVQHPLPLGREVEKGQVSWLRSSPQNGKLLWLLADPKKPAKTELYATVWNSEGRPDWRHVLPPPTQNRDDQLWQAGVDESGALWLLLGPPVDEEASSTQLKLLRYQARTRKWLQTELHWPARLLHVQLGLPAADPQQNPPQVLALLSQPDTGFVNGRMLETSARWSSVALTHVLPSADTLAAGKPHITLLPDSLIKRYAKARNGANFTQDTLLYNGGQWLWLWQEVFARDERKLLEDILVVAVDRQSGELPWVTAVQKRQSDRKPAALMGYAPFLSGPKRLNLYYLTEKSIDATLRCTAVSTTDGDIRHLDLAGNLDSQNYFFPRRSVQTATGFVWLMGLMEPQANNYGFLRIKQ